MTVTLPPIPRRHFLELLAFGVPAAVIEQKVGAWEKLRSYFIPRPEPSWEAYYLHASGVYVATQRNVELAGAPLTPEIIRAGLERLHAQLGVEYHSPFFFQGEWRYPPKSS